MNTEAALAHARKTVLLHLAKEGSGRTFGHLMVACGFQKATYTDDSRLPESRVLDRTLQSLRRDRIIRFEKREWHLVTGEGTCPTCQKPMGSNPECDNCKKLPETLEAFRGGDPVATYVHMHEHKACGATANCGGVVVRCTRDEGHAFVSFNEGRTGHYSFHAGDGWTWDDRCAWPLGEEPK